MAKTFSGKALIKILCREFGFYFISQRGSHEKLRRESNNRTITTTKITKNFLFLLLFFIIIKKSDNTGL